jgi:hypothetical protein
MQRKIADQAGSWAMDATIFPPGVTGGSSVVFAGRARCSRAAKRRWLRVRSGGACTYKPKARLLTGPLIAERTVVKIRIRPAGSR